MIDFSARDLAFFVTAAKGTEVCVRDELRELRFPKIRADRGGVHFHGPLSEGMRACLWSRSGLRVLLKLGEFETPTGGALYDAVRTIDWAPFVSPSQTLMVRSSTKNSALSHTQFIAQKTKDAIVDQIRENQGARPSVQMRDSDLVVFVHLNKDICTLYADLAGASLHQRGYRQSKAEAPLKETLAASLLRLSGWDTVTPLIDPLCGSGTIPIEAALLATNRAPGMLRKRFGFEGWPVFRGEFQSTMTELRTEARDKMLPLEVPIAGSDSDSGVIEMARENAERAGVSIHWEKRSLEHVHPEGPTFIVTNPPYGERLSLSPQLAATLGHLARGPDIQLSLIAPPQALERIEQRPRWTHPLFNGDLACIVANYGRRAPDRT